MPRNASFILTGTLMILLVAAPAVAAYSATGVHGISRFSNEGSHQPGSAGSGGPGRAVSHLKPIKTPKQCYRVCKRMGGMTDDFCAWSCMR